MTSREIVATDVLQWLTLYSVEARIEECLFQQELVEKDEKRFDIIENEN